MDKVAQHFSTTSSELRRISSEFRREQQKQAAELISWREDDGLCEFRRDCLAVFDSWSECLEELSLCLGRQSVLLRGDDSESCQVVPHENLDNQVVSLVHAIDDIRTCLDKSYFELTSDSQSENSWQPVEHLLNVKTVLDARELMSRKHFQLISKHCLSFVSQPDQLLQDHGWENPQPGLCRRTQMSLKIFSLFPDHIIRPSRSLKVNLCVVDESSAMSICKNGISPGFDPPTERVSIESETDDDGDGCYGWISTEISASPEAQILEVEFNGISVSLVDPHPCDDSDDESDSDFFEQDKHEKIEPSKRESMTRNGNFYYFLATVELQVPGIDDGCYESVTACALSAPVVVTSHASQLKESLISIGWENHVSPISHRLRDLLLPSQTSDQSLMTANSQQLGDILQFCFHSLTKFDLPQENLDCVKQRLMMMESDGGSQEGISISFEQLLSRLGGSEDETSLWSWLYGSCGALRKPYYRKLWGEGRFLGFMENPAEMIKQRMKDDKVKDNKKGKRNDFMITFTKELNYNQRVFCVT